MDHCTTNVVHTQGQEDPDDCLKGSPFDTPCQKTPAAREDLMITPKQRGKADWQILVKQDAHRPRPSHALDRASPEPAPASPLGLGQELVESLPPSR
jgi:hypothetical protein